MNMVQPKHTGQNGTKQNKPDKLEDMLELSLLYDFYGALLKEQKRSIFEAYILEDFSLSEIAKDMDMSRQAVYDVVRRCRKELREYEGRLHLVHKFHLMKGQVHEIQKRADAIAGRRPDQDVADALREISDIANQILDGF